MSALAWVDVFASAPMTGNPLAVVLDAGGWDAGRMQALAAELGISETAYVLPPTEAGADHRVRIFTPRRELPLAGHPVVGATWVLRAAGRLGDEGRLETAAGVLAVRARGPVATVALAAPQRGPEADAREAAAAAGVRPADGVAARVWSAGVPQLMLRADGPGEVERARPDADALARLAERDGWLGVSVYAPDDGAGDGRTTVRVRHFAPLIGVPEDPVTGSAAGALGACLAAGGAGGGGDLEMVVRQGRPGGRGGEVAVRVRCEGGVPRGVQIGGRVVPLFEGRLVTT
ncbi:PhzF family phenazine biosynthesis protein [Miltoncostaea marina]|uniref:PhzF family phenazine biosynthesis protein n=1 Tax=Miltoncostaea marina TaxID=2843215 RepID=UPI001C3E6928|nr:PhzF family phenazine biosynthesis protein [Miltoncostaea marina]